MLIQLNLKELQNYFMAKPKYSKGQIFLYLEKKKIFEIHNVYSIDDRVAPRPPFVKADNLYTVIYLPKKGKPEFGRYYESKITQKCTPIKNIEIAQILYGVTNEQTK